VSPYIFLCTMLKSAGSLILFILFAANGYSSEIKGVIKDKKTNELLVGATVLIKELKIGTISGLDGSYHLKNVPTGTHTIVCSFLSYKSEEKVITMEKGTKELSVDYFLEPSSVDIKEVTVYGQKVQNSEISARESERDSPNIMNVISAKTIELSPDQDVANVVKRMSGVTLDRSSSGTGQYALIRGMDRRYSYTLINGIKIPSTNDKQRYVSLDIFPSDLVDRIEVTKVLTPDMEGDAISGAVNLVMKNAPDKFIFQTYFSAGFSEMWLQKSFLTFNSSDINKKSPYEVNGSSYYAVPSDFPKSNLDQTVYNIPANITAGITIGSRFFRKKFGWILSASFNNQFKGANSLIFGVDQATDGSNLPVLTSMVQRNSYDHQQNYGIHAKLDYIITPNHKLQFYTAYMNFKLKQVWDWENTELGNNSYDPAHGSMNITHSDRDMLNIQQLLNTTLQGEHHITKKIWVQWSAVYSKASNETPDLSTVTYDKTYINYILQPQYVDFGGSDRLWLHNTDQDLAGYLNLSYKTSVFKGKIEIKAGGLYRDTKRASFYNDYTLIPKGPVDAHSAKGIDWINYSDINWTVQNPTGAVNTPGTFNAYETVFAQYGMIQYEISRFRLIFGLRNEYTTQGYNEVFHNAFLDQFKPGNNQKRDHINDYLLPSLNFQYSINRKSNLKASYYRAINKPGFLEIVPYLDNTGDYPKTGNPDLKNAVADNYDIRYEFFPNQLDQILVGTFYKKITNAIEEGFMVDGHGNYSLSFSNSNATNYGFEADIIKYFRQFGIKANYTWTKSSTQSFKRSQVNGVINRDSTISSMQTRPLAGQSENVGNISLLYKSVKAGIDAQLALSYTGDRIYKVSPDINGDLWQQGFWQLDLSAEKRFKNGLGIFIKGHNLLNTHVKVYIKQKNSFNDQFPYQTASEKNTLVRDEYSGPSFLAGVRYKFN